MIYLFSYILITAISSIFIYNLGKEFPQNLLLLLSTIYAIIFFHLINFRKIIPTYKILFAHKALYLLLMLSIFIIWLGTFIGTIYISPTFLDFVLMGIGATYGSIFSYLATKTRLNFISMILISLIMLSFCSTLFVKYPPLKAALMILFIITLGIFDYLYTITSYKLSKRLSTSQILACRFWLMFFICLFVVIGNREYEFLFTNYSLIPKSILLVAINFIIPIFLYQKSIIKVGPNLTLTMIGIIPLAAFVFERLLIKNPPSPVAFGVLSLLLAMAVCLPYLSGKIFKKRQVLPWSFN